MSKSTRIKHTMQGTAPRPRNPLALAVRCMRASSVAPKRGKGSYKREKKVED